MERVVFFLPSVNSTPTNTAHTELHSMITFHHANTRGSRAGRPRIAHLCVIKQLSSTCHVSFLAAPDTDDKHKVSLTHFIHFSCLSDCLTFTKKPCDSQPLFSLRCSTAEWRINTNPTSHTLRIPCACLSRVGGMCEKPLRLEVLKDFSASRLRLEACGRQVL